MNALRRWGGVLIPLTSTFNGWIILFFGTVTTPYRIYMAYGNMPNSPWAPVQKVHEQDPALGPLPSFGQV